jgi:uncharacterized repeat protein (TIGR03803 family)
MRVTIKGFGHIFGAAFAVAAFCSTAALAGNLTTLHAFTAHRDGGNPHGALLQLNNLFYGTTMTGGSHSDGSVFVIDPSTGKETILYSFKGGRDGSQPIGGLVYQGSLLYGVTQAGGKSGVGTVYSVDPSTGAEKVVHAFLGFSDGQQPSGGLTANNGILYGATWAGGSAGGGTVYSVDVASRKETVLSAFGGIGTGQNPVGTLLYLNGGLYGVTSNGGAQKHEESGTIFVVQATGGGGRTLYSFDQPGSFNDGLNPWGGLIANGSLLYGTTYGGGTDHCGTIYSFDPSSRTETVVHDFTCGSDGGYPFPTLVAQGGILYGATSFGALGNCGGSGCGAAYAFDPSSSTIQSLHEFSGNSDGGNPEAELFAAGGMLYGTTFDGGKKGLGTVFALTP